MRILLAAVLAMASIAATDAAAEDWQMAGDDPEKVVGVDVASVEGEGEVRTANVIFVFAQPVEDADFMVSSATFRCTDHTVLETGSAFYSLDGAVLDTLPGTGETRTIQPGSHINAVEEMVCEGLRNPPGDAQAKVFAERARAALGVRARLKGRAS